VGARGRPEELCVAGGFPAESIAQRESTRQAALNPSEFDWGALDKSDRDMGDGQMVEWAVKFLRQTTPATVLPGYRHFPAALAVVCARNISTCIRRTASRRHRSSG